MIAKSTNRAEKQRLFRRTVVLAILVQVPVAWWIVDVLPPDPWRLLALVALLLWINGGIVVHTRHIVPARPLSRWQRVAVVYPAVIAWFACLLLALPFLLVDVIRITGGPVNLGIEVSILGVGLLVSVYATLVRTRRVRLRHYTVPLPRLPGGLEGYRIVHLSDLHIGNFYGQRDLCTWARMVDRVRPDLVVLTGDLIDSGDHALDTLCEGLRAFQARDGVYACPGNHDSLAACADYWDRIEATGVRVLRNQGVHIDYGAARFCLAGVDDAWQGRHDIERALSCWDGTSVCILLAHDPRLERQAVSRRVDLVLFGHTHGGQVAVPFFPAWNLTARTYPHGGGLRKVGPSLVHVSRGLGTAGIPVRLGVAPEIVVLDLRRG